MSSNNINDPTAIKALLDQLRTSRAWQDTLAAGHPAREPPARLQDHDAQGSSPGPPPLASVASLLSQLQPSDWTPSAINTPPSNTQTAHSSSPPLPIPRPLQGPPPIHPEHRTPRPAPTPDATRVQDIRSMSFQQALPHLTRLASDPEFMPAISRLRQEQDQLEQQLWEERQAIHKQHEDKGKVAQTKAALIGAGLSKHEVDMMNDAYRRDLHRFDTERVLVAWDALVQKQQAALETLGVPTMFATGSQANCEKQRRVVQILEGLE